MLPVTRGSAKPEQAQTAHTYTTGSGCTVNQMGAGLLLVQVWVCRVNSCCSCWPAVCLCSKFDALACMAANVTDVPAADRHCCTVTETG